MLLGHLLSLLLASRALAARCCSDRGGDANDLRQHRKYYNETRTLWKLRVQLCRHPATNSPVDGGYAATARVFSAETNAWATYAFWARDPSGAFASCWDTTRELLDECATEQGARAGSWEQDGEQYVLSLPRVEAPLERRSAAQTMNMKMKRNLLPKRSVDELASFSEGRYTINGTEITVFFENTLKDLPHTPVPNDSSDTYTASDAAALRRRAGGLQTNEGVTFDWAITTTFEVQLEDILAYDLQRRKAEADNDEGDESDRAWPSFDRPSDTCAASATSQRSEPDNVRRTWSAIQIGTWHWDWTRVSGCLAYGWYNPGGHYQGSGQTFNASWSADVPETIMDDAISSALYAGHTVARTYTQSDIEGCYWNKGVCHVMWTKQPMVWQRGLVIEYPYSQEEDDITATVKFVHVDQPLTYAISGCNSGCCETCPNDIPWKSPLTEWHCASFAAGKEAWYGVCNDWDQDPFAKAC